MKKTAQAYWQRLKEAYQKTHHAPIFTDYEKSVPYVKDFKAFIATLLERDEKNVFLISLYASLNQELRNEPLAIQSLEDFIKAHKTTLTPHQKARLYTNLAFYHEGDEKALEYLLKAEQCASPYLETYKGLGLYYFSKYQYTKKKAFLTKSLQAFEKAQGIKASYEMTLGKAVCLFELKRYKEAKEVFESLLLTHPKRMRLQLGLAYCEVYLERRDTALSYLKELCPGQDNNYFLSTDDIDNFEIYDAYYALEAYDLFVDEAKKVIMDYALLDGAYYYYALWHTGRHDLFKERLEHEINRLLTWLDETKVDEDFENEKEREETIKSYQKEIEALTKMAQKITTENHKPRIKLTLYPEYGCYLIDCIRHNF